MKKEIIVTNIFSVPSSHVWKAWTDPEMVMKWWGPEHFTSPSAKLDFREGGTSIVCMKAPKEMGGRDLYNTWKYTKIVPTECIEFIQNLSDQNGNKIAPASIGMPADFPEDVKTVVTFKELTKNTTEMTITEYASFGEIGHFAQIGLEQCVNKMDKLFAKA
ncbi:MAG TPA: SRPBCC domain-containing protein [Cytophagaceae bacterium]|nr:SRPBCC domain-containing protein [Cytophagaceae bacterium]